MAAILGAVGSAVRDFDRALPDMTARLRRRARAEAGIWRSDEAVLWAGVHPWEAEVGGWTGPRVVDTGRFVIVVDANLYDLDLRGSPPANRDDNDSGTARDLGRLLLLNGAGFCARVDGDFAIAAWDKLEKRLTLARDRWGQRPIAYTVLSDGGVLFASSPAALVEHPRVSRDLDVDYLAAAAAHAVPPGDRCAWRDVRMVPLGAVAVLNMSGGVERWQTMAPPRFATSPHETPRSEAARQLQVLLGKAVEKRVPRTTRTAIWLSGGYDSPAVYGAGRKALGRRTAAGSELVPVSLSYPPGDRGREDELIREIAAMWDAEINWVNSQDIPLLAGIEDRARERDDPFAHPFEPVQRMLARTAKACDCRVVLDGNGGDQAFSAGDGMQADALQSGEWGDLYRQYRRTRAPFRDFARAAILPLLGRSTREWLSQLRGKELRGYWDTRVPDWMSQRESLTRAAQGYVEPEPGESLTAFEARFLLGHPHLSRVISWAYAFGLDEGIVLRSPLLDLDVVEFIAGRPITDRFDGATNKVLLRDSVRGLLPDSVLASRREKTGTPVDYVRREYREGLAPELRRVFGGGRRVRLVEMGVVLADALKRAISEYERGLDYQLGHLLVSTMQAEWWIAGQLQAE